MNPLQFEARHRTEWEELRSLLEGLRARGAQREAAAASGARIALLYRRCCEHLALATTRGYPSHIVDTLQQLSAEAHQLIYQRRDFSVAGLARLLRVDIPRAVRAHAGYVWVAAAVFVLPALLVGWIVHRHPEAITLVVDSATAREFEGMYSEASQHIGRARNADTDWAMFGFYIRNNIGIAFQCFAGGIFLGVGSFFFLGYNGVFTGALAGYLAARGLGSTFFPFIATHSAFELTAVVLSGAAGLRLGAALLAPGRLTRLEALKTAARDAIVIVYGVIAMLLIAAALEAFWSSSAWIPPPVKLAVAGVAWTAVLAYLTLQGRDAA